MKRLLPALVLAGALTGALGCPNTDPPRVIGKAIRQTPIFATASQAISLSPELNASMGTPITIGDPQLKQMEGDAEVGTATLEIPISGPRNEGKVIIRVGRRDPKAPWVSKGGDFVPSSGGPPIHLASH